MSPASSRSSRPGASTCQGPGKAQALVRELQDYEIRVDEITNNRYGAFKVGTHDDPVTALGLAIQVDYLSLGGALPNVPGW